MKLAKISVSFTAELAKTRTSLGGVGALTHGFARAYGAHGAHERYCFNVGEAAFIAFTVKVPCETPSKSPVKHRQSPPWRLRNILFCAILVG